LRIELLVMELARRRYLFRGRVQGVGFRMRTERIAGNFLVSGYVRNLDDGRVEVVAEGETAELDSFVAAIHGAFGDKIRSVEVSEQVPDSALLDGFSIRY
jgi:acylphosphatase